MEFHRRDILKATVPIVAGAGIVAVPQKAALAAQPRLAAEDFGLQPDGKKDQTAALQAAIDKAAAKGVALTLVGGQYLTGPLRLPSNSAISGAGPQTRLVFTGGAALFQAKGGEGISITSLMIDGAGLSLKGEKTGLLAFQDITDLQLTQLHVESSAGHGCYLQNCGGQVLHCSFKGHGEAALFALDSKGLEVAYNHVQDCGNNGLLIWRSKKGDDGSLIAHNRIEGIKAQAGGSGQNGNGINVYRAGGVIVSGNQIRDCAFSAIRANSSDNVQIVNNSCHQLGEVALYSEFSFEGAVISNNLVDGAHVGISVTNFNEGGRLASVTGNLLRNMKKRKGEAAIGLAVEADSSVTANTIENVEGLGISLGFGKYLREVIATSNLIRGAEIGIGVSTHNDAGIAMITNNMISGAKNGGIRAMDETKPLGPDLARNSAEAFRNLLVFGNASL